MADGAVISLLRHGETGQSGFRGRLDDPLTPAGWEQMRRATHEARMPWQAVVSSPLVRCADFAHAFAAERGLPVEWDARLAELDFGDWEGLEPRVLQHSQPDALTRFWNDPWAFTPPKGERMAEFETRVRAAWADISERHAGHPVLVVTHGGVIRLLLCLARGLARDELLRLAVSHASLHRIGACKSVMA
jgi:alpha-ribazole phosphatase